MNDGGAAFTSGAHKAWLALPASVSASSFTLDGQTTDINVAEKLSNTEKVIYNLNGQRILNPSKGLYIVNGKKIVMK